MAHRKLPLASPFGPVDLVAAAHQTVSSALRVAPFAEALAIAAAAGSWVEDALADVETRIPPARPSACRERCAFCCHLKVLATAPEVMRLAEHLRTTLDTTALAALRERVARADEATDKMTTEARVRARLPCPLLVESRCAGYEARPLACRGANSFDAAQCEKAYQSPDEPVEIPLYKPRLQVTEAVRAGIAGGVAALGLDGRLFELNAALRIALEEPEPGVRWAAGEPAFAEALDAEFEAAMRRMRAEQQKKA
jgi:Fe-S-cluster containining protein